MSASALPQRIENAVLAGKRARSDFFASIGQADMQELAKGAELTQIRELERAIAAELPSDYKHFLAAHNGWKMIDAICDLYSVDEIARRLDDATIQNLKEDFLERVGGGATAILPIGGSSFSAKTYLLAKVDNPAGSWNVFVFDSDTERYASFVEYLETSTTDFRRSASEASEAMRLIWKMSE